MHEVAQGVDPQARVVYADVDPVVGFSRRASAVRQPSGRHDLRGLAPPEAILSHRSLRETLDLTQPVGLLLVSAVHYLSDCDAYPAVVWLRAALPPNSGLVISHAATEGLARDSSEAAAAVYQRSTVPGGAVRTQAEIERFFYGYDLVGLVKPVRLRCLHILVDQPAEDRPSLDPGGVQVNNVATGWVAAGRVSDAT